MHPAFSIFSVSLSCICMSLSRFLRNAASSRKKRECRETPHPPPLTPDLTPTVPPAVFSAMWLTLTKGGELEGNFLLTASTPEFPNIAFSVVSMKLSCFSLANKQLRVCAEHVHEPSTALPFSSSSPPYWQRHCSGKIPFLLPHQ